MSVLVNLGHLGVRWDPLRSPVNSSQNKHWRGGHISVGNTYSQTSSCVQMQVKPQKDKGSLQ